MVAAVCGLLFLGYQGDTRLMMTGIITSVDVQFPESANSKIVVSGLNILGQPRLGLAITVEKGNTGGTGLEFAYDHPDAESRLEVQNDQGLSILGL